MTTSSSSLSGSFQASRFETSSAPVMKNHSPSGARSLRIRTVSTLCIGRTASISTRSTPKRSLPSTAASTMSKRSSALARTLEASLCGGMPAGTNTTRARPSSPMTCSAITMCPWCTGSKVPPKIPTLTVGTSPEVEHRPADPDLVAGLGARATQRAHDAAPLQLPLEALDALRVLPVGLEREALDALAGNDVAAVLPLHPHALPRRAEDAVRAIRALLGPAISQLSQALLEDVAQLFDAFAGLGRDLNGVGEGLSQVRPELLVQEVHLVEHCDGGLPRESGGVQLRPEGAVGPLRVLARVQNQRQEPRAGDVPEEPIAEAAARARPLDQPGNVSDHERPAVTPVVGHPQLRRERGERVIADPGTRRAQGTKQRRLPGVRKPDEAHVREDFELEPDLPLLPRQTLLAERGRPARRGREGGVPATAVAASGRHEGRARLREVGEQSPFVAALGADGDLDQGVLPALA